MTMNELLSFIAHIQRMDTPGTNYSQQECVNLVSMCILLAIVCAIPAARDGI